MALIRRLSGRRPRNGRKWLAMERFMRLELWIVLELPVPVENHTPLLGTDSALHFWVRFYWQTETHTLISSIFMPCVLNSHCAILCHLSRPWRHHGLQGMHHGSKTAYPFLFFIRWNLVAMLGGDMFQSLWDLIDAHSYPGCSARQDLQVQNCLQALAVFKIVVTVCHRMYSIRVSELFSLDNKYACVWQLQQWIVNRDGGMISFFRTKKIETARSSSSDTAISDELLVASL